jgi:hypothetical protein
MGLGYLLTNGYSLRQVHSPAAGRHEKSARPAKQGRRKG